MRRSLFVGCLLALLVAAACGTGAPATTAPAPSASSPADWAQAGANEVLPIAVSSELAVGPNRFLLNIVDRQNEPLASPERTLELRFFDLAASTTQAANTVAGTYLPTIAGLPGLYRATIELDSAGMWGVEAVLTEPDGSTRSGRLAFSVREEFSTPAIGEPAPASNTPTAGSAAEIATLSTDDEPIAHFYGTSVADALAAGEPFLLIFSTPAFCRTATCGPALDIVKGVAPEFDGAVTFIHVEPYQLESVNGQLQPVIENGQLVPVPSVIEWGLLTEPYIFVVDAQGDVSAKLEGVASEEEIRAALEQVTR